MRSKIFQMDSNFSVIALSKDIEIKIKNDFPSDYLNTISLIDNFCSSRDYLQHERIIRCILYLADKQIEKVSHYLRLAATDPRDVMLWAEYEKNDDQNDKRVRDFNKSFAENSVK